MTGSPTTPEARTDRAEEIMDLVAEFGAALALGQGPTSQDDAFRLVESAITAITAECERMRAVVEAALLNAKVNTTGTRRLMIDALHTYQDATPAPPKEDGQ